MLWRWQVFGINKEFGEIAVGSKTVGAIAVGNNDGGGANTVCGLTQIILQPKLTEFARLHYPPIYDISTLLGLAVSWPRNSE